MGQKILIIDDETMLTDLLAAHFETRGYRVLVANSAAEALTLLPQGPDLILLDIQMPGVDGMTLCRQIRGVVTCPILFLTARITEQDKVTGLESGGDDYITKPFSLKELTARVEAHLRRDERGRAAPKVLSSQGLILDLSGRRALYEGTPLSLSRREFDILEFLMKNANLVFDRERIYEAVWGLEAEGDSGVVKEHIRKIRSKLHEATGQDCIETVWGMGYKWKK